MWKIYYRYFHTEGSDVVGDDTRIFSTLEGAEEAVIEDIFKDFFDYEGVEGFEDEDYVGDSYPRFPGNWPTIQDGDEAIEGEGNWFELPPENTTMVEVPLVRAHLHTQYNWAFRDDDVLVYVKRV